MQIGIINDLPMAAEAMRRALSARPDYKVIWTARNGVEGVQCCARHTPDLVLMDLVMPEMDGVEATRRIMAQCPCAILVVTSSVTDNAPKVFEAMSAGALDAVDTPTLCGANGAAGTAMLLAKVDLMRRVTAHGLVRKAVPTEPVRVVPVGQPQFPLIAIGSSAGGPAALAAVLGGLPANLAAGVVIIQHVDEQFALSLASWLRQQSPIPVVPAGEGDAVAPGRVLLAARNDHLVFTGPRCVGYTEHPREMYYRPSVDVFFESILQHWRGEVVGVLLTGMGRDGAQGLKSLRDAGIHTIAQDQATCAVYGMPKAAAQLNAAVEILPLPEIAGAVLRRCRLLNGGAHR